MIYGLVDGKRALATPQLHANCPICGAGLLSKCGCIKAWHWAHVSGSDCEKWAEGESDWHWNWKEYFGIENCERVITRDGVIHRADIQVLDTVIELQHSHISVDEIVERENFYVDMIWIFDAVAAYDEDRLSIKAEGPGVSFIWKRPRKSLQACSAKCYLDIGGTFLQITKLNDDFTGNGYIKTPAKLRWQLQSGPYPKIVSSLVDELAEMEGIPARVIWWQLKQNQGGTCQPETSIEQLQEREAYLRSWLENGYTGWRGAYQSSYSTLEGLWT